MKQQSLERHDLGGLMLDAVNLHLEAKGTLPSARAILKVLPKTFL
jgi:hypothetical protein